MTKSSDKSPSIEADWAGFRRQMPVARRWAYLDHAAVAPLTGPAQDALGKWAADAAGNGATPYSAWMHQLEQLRGLAARMISAEPQEIALVGNTTDGITLVAEGYPWRSGDNVVIREDEFPSNQYPWMNLSNRGVETRRIPVRGDETDLDRLAAACDDRTRIVAVSWVTYSTGWRHDVDRLAQIAHDHGALLFLDAIQGLGAFPLDVKKTPVDFLAADGHKWLLGPERAGIFFARREHLDLLRPFGVGWHSVAHAHDFARIELILKDTAERYEGGSPNTPGLIGLGASLQLLSRFGFEALAQRVLEISDLACARLQQIGAVIHSDRRGPHNSGIVAFELPDRDPQALQQRCLEQDVVLSCRGGRLRISPHAYNDHSDVDRLIQALK